MNRRKNAKKYHKVIIVNEFNEWVSTSGDCTIQEAIELYKSETHKGELGYNKEYEYYAFGVDKAEHEIDFGGKYED